MIVSVIATVYNEGGSIRALLESLAAQSRRPDEVVIVDGGSTDDTLAVLREYETRLPLRIHVAPGANISRGRNLAIERAAGPIIAATDAGVRLAPDWLARIASPLDAGAQVASGLYECEADAAFEVAMGATVLPLPSEIDPRRFLPSSRSVAFTKEAWRRAGGYPEWLDYCEDLVFDLLLLETTGPFAFAPGAVARFRPRGSLRAFFAQYYRYARGDGKADLWRLRHLIRYSTYLLGVPAVVASGILVHPLGWAAGALLAFRGLLWTPYRRLLRSWRGLGSTDRARALLWVPVIRITGDVAKMIGYPAGLLWRIRRLRTDPRVTWRTRRTWTRLRTGRARAGAAGPRR